MQTQEHSVFASLKCILTSFSCAAKIPLIPTVSPVPKIKKEFLRLMVWDDEPLSTPNIITFWAKLSFKLHELSTWNAIP